MRCALRALLLLVSLAGAFSPLEAGEKFSAKLRDILRTWNRDERLVLWVYFTDKGGAQKSAIPLQLVTDRALARRRNALPEGPLVDRTDLPVEQSYVDRLVSVGAQVRQVSKWLNAASITTTPAAIEAIADLPFVLSLDLVSRSRRDPVRTATADTAALPKPLGKPDGKDLLDYGPSLAQVSLLNVPAVHTTGNSAQGIIIGVFDNGFRLPAHESFASMSILGTRDFVDKKTSVVPNNPSSAFGSHGVNTLSTIGGYKPGQLIGPAYGATYILARTENDSSETPFEEDNWVAAIEWAESLGVQVTSTSLGYLTYDPPFTSWTWADMDGQTTPITRAAAMAVRKGVIVVNSAGNNGSSSTQNTLNAPADADSVLSVGAVTPAGVRASFSSVGPTTSIPPRIKPDVMATGTSVYAASSTITTGYNSVSGTSFSCPLAAGVAALVLKARPSATPMQVVEALKITASQASAPDNLFGWGIIDAAKAITYLTSADTGEDTNSPIAFSLRQNFPNPFNPGTRIIYQLKVNAAVTLRVYDLLGREVRTLVDAHQAMGPYLREWDGTDNNGAPAAAGAYFYRLEAREGTGKATSVTRKMVLIR
jgi:subtilisin family serine protease